MLNTIDTGADYSNLPLRTVVSTGTSAANRMKVLPAGRIFFPMVEKYNENIDMRRHVSCHD